MSWRLTAAPLPPVTSPRSSSSGWHRPSTAQGLGRSVTGRSIRSNTPTPSDPPNMSVWHLSTLHPISLTPHRSLLPHTLATSGYPRCLRIAHNTFAEVHGIATITLPLDGGELTLTVLYVPTADRNVLSVHQLDRELGCAVAMGCGAVEVFKKSGGMLARGVPAGWGAWVVAGGGHPERQRVMAALLAEGTTDDEWRKWRGRLEETRGDVVRGGVVKEDGDGDEVMKEEDWGSGDEGRMETGN